MPKALKGKKRPASSRKKTLEVKPISAKVVLHPSEDTPQYYVNYAEIATSQHEFSIYGVKIPTKLPLGEVETVTKSEELHLEAEVQIIIPVTMIQGLIDALISQRDFYAAQFGTTISMQIGEKK